MTGGFELKNWVSRLKGHCYFAEDEVLVVSACELVYAALQVGFGDLLMICISS